MKKRKQWTIFTIMCALFLLMQGQTAEAAERKPNDARIIVNDYEGDISSLRVYCDEEIYSSSGKKLTSTEDALNCTFTKEDEKCVTTASLYTGVKYLISDGIESVTFTLDIPSSDAKQVDMIVSWKDAGQSDGGTATTDAETDETNVTGDETASKMSKTGALDVSTKGPSTAGIGDTVKYTITSLTGAEDSDTFLLQCNIPKGMELVSVYTGTYNSDVKMELLCKTENDGMWHSWGTDISSLKGSTFSTKDISFAEGDRISAIALSAETIPKDFALVKEDPFYYQMKIVSEEGVENNGAKARLTAYVGKTKQSSESRFLMAIKNGVQTGDDNYLLIGSFILLVVSVVFLMGYLTVRVVGNKREQIYADKGAPVKFKKDKTAGEGKELTFLKDKNPG